MPRRLVRFGLVLVTALLLMGFRMPVTDEARDKTLYDVRGAFVTARPDVSKGLVIATDMLVDEAIRGTFRSTMLPRTIISVRIEKATQVSVFIGKRHEAKVTVQAIAVGNGEPIAQGTFRISVFLMKDEGADQALAEKIADRIAMEFRLSGQRRPTIASALFDRVEP